MQTEPTIDLDAIDPSPDLIDLLCVVTDNDAIYAYICCFRSVTRRFDQFLVKKGKGERQVHAINATCMTALRKSSRAGAPSFFALQLHQQAGACFYGCQASKMPEAIAPGACGVLGADQHCVAISRHSKHPTVRPCMTHRSPLQFLPSTINIVKGERYTACHQLHDPYEALYC